MSVNEKYIVKMLLVLCSLLMVSMHAFASSAICAKIENDPVTKALLDPAPNHIEGFESHVYKSLDGVDLRLHVFSRDNKKSGNVTPTPAILFFYGGAWEYGTVMELVEPAKYFSHRGAVSILVDYRVFCRHGNSIADEISDAKSAVRYVRQHASQFGIDPNRIVVSGGSAGGHLALSTATIKDFEPAGEDYSISSKPNLLTLFYPCSDVTTEDEKMYGGDAIGQYGKEVSPLYNIHKNLPPMLIVQGTDDIVYKENKKFCTESTKNGNSCKLIIYQGAPHGFFSPENKKWYQKAVKKMDEFLTGAGYLEHK